MTPSEEELQPRWGTRSPWLLDRSDEEAGRKEQYSSTLNFTLMMSGVFSRNVSKSFRFQAIIREKIHSGGSFDDSCLKQKVALFSPHVHV